MPTQLKVKASSLNCRKTPSPTGTIIGAFSQNQVVDLIEISPDQKWAKITGGSLTGWSFFSFLEPIITVTNIVDEIINIAATSAISKFSWANRGIAPMGYIKGMSLAYARVYCKLKANHPAAIEMAKANTGDKDADVLAYYAKEFNDLAMSNDAAGADTLRHLFVVMLGLGMRESSGRYCEGRDRAATNTTANTAEAGMFQTSFNAKDGHAATNLMMGVFQQYQANASGFIDVFKEGVTATAKDLENFGSGNGLLFQQLSKNCPAFTVEFSAIALRNIRTHWGPINRKQAEVKVEANKLLTQVQHVIDINNVQAI